MLAKDDFTFEILYFLHVINFRGWSSLYRRAKQTDDDVQNLKTQVDETKQL